MIQSIKWRANLSNPDSSIITVKTVVVPQISDEASSVTSITPVIRLEKNLGAEPGEPGLL